MISYLSGRERELSIAMQNAMKDPSPDNMSHVIFMSSHMNFDSLNKVMAEVRMMQK